MTYATVSIEPGSREALAITAKELRVVHYTGRSVSRGYGRDKVTSYRSGVQTELGDIELSQWQALMRDIIHRSGELKLLEQLTEWELETTPWIHTRKDAEQCALEAFANRWFDNLPTKTSRPSIKSIVRKLFNITITMNIYAHLDTTAKDVSAAAMSQALSLPEHNGGYGWQRN